jgi:hypothetical protein
MSMKKRSRPGKRLTIALRKRRKRLPGRFLQCFSARRRPPAPAVFPGRKAQTVPRSARRRAFAADAFPGQEAQNRVAP